MYEVELKVEITATERTGLLTRLGDRGFLSDGVSSQEDYYIQVEKSEHGGNNIKRYRHEDDKYIYTEKMWEMVGDTLARHEDEHEVSKEEFESKLTEFSGATKIVKRREWFGGKDSLGDISIVIDTVKFDHSLADRYFVEAEIIVENKEKVKETKERIKNFLKDILDTNDIILAPGMCAMACEKK